MYTTLLNSIPGSGYVSNILDNCWSIARYDSIRHYLEIFDILPVVPSQGFLNCHCRFELFLVSLIMNVLLVVLCIGYPRRYVSNILDNCWSIARHKSIRHYLEIFDILPVALNQRVFELPLVIEIAPNRQQLHFIQPYSEVRSAEGERVFCKKLTENSLNYLSTMSQVSFQIV